MTDSYSIRERSQVAAAIRGDADALRAVWQHHRRWVAAVLLTHKPSSADVDDLLQEVALTVLAKVRTLDNPGNFQSWLRVHVRWAVLQKGRGRRPTASIQGRNLRFCRGGDFSPGWQKARRL